MDSEGFGEPTMANEFTACPIRGQQWQEHRCCMFGYTQRQQQAAYTVEARRQ